MNKIVKRFSKKSFIPLVDLNTTPFINEGRYQLVTEKENDLSGLFDR